MGRESELWPVISERLCHWCYKSHFCQRTARVWITDITDMFVISGETCLSPLRGTQFFQQLQWLKPQTCRLAVCSTKFGRGSLWVIVSVLLLKTGTAWKDWQWPFVYWPPAAYTCPRRALHKQCAALKKVNTARVTSVATALFTDLTAEVNIDPKHTVAPLCKSSKLSPPLTLSVLWTADNGPIGLRLLSG